MHDKELLERAAGAAAFTLEESIYPGWFMCDVRQWNPLIDDGDAFRLAVKIGIDLHPREFGAEAVCMAEGITVRQLGDGEDSARRAIVRVAAEIGELLVLSNEPRRSVGCRASKLLGPEQSVWMAGGFALDAIGAHESIQLRRHQVPRLENDDDYRKRIVARMRGESKPDYSDWADGIDAPQTAG